jgi:signal transduction histidine kinase
MMVLGLDNKNIAEELRTPLSTIQRRTRILLRSGYVNQLFQPNYKKLGLKKGLLHVYLHTGNIKRVAEDLLSNDGIMSSAVHVGNSDLVEEFVYEDSEQLVDLISKVKAIDEVDRVVWSEEVFLLPGKKPSVLAVLNRIIDNR